MLIIHLTSFIAFYIGWHTGLSVSGFTVVMRYGEHHKLTLMNDQDTKCR